MDDLTAHLHHLQGRIIALEVLMRGFLTDLAMKSDTPQVRAATMRKAFMASLQHLERPVGAAHDQIWSEAADALNLQFDCIETRLQNLGL